MKKHVLIEVPPEVAFADNALKSYVAGWLKVEEDEIMAIRTERRSVDARSKRIRVNLSLIVYLNETPAEPLKTFQYRNVSGCPEVLVAGAGPAGLFAALRLIELGLKPVIFERGKPVHERVKDIELLDNSGVLNPESNYCFGEGGAGTYSDGKLYTRSKKRGNHYKVLEVLHFFGAQEEILFDAHPHIGSDRLPGIIANIRKGICQCGGVYHFGALVTDIIVDTGKVSGVVVNNAERVPARALILATGHSSRDIYEMLRSKGIDLEIKPFAMGVRVEHPQAFINQVQYGSRPSPMLPPATYSVAEQVEGRGVYSFCMCPGGQIVPSATRNNELVVNGMSNALRNSSYANSGLVVQVLPSDYSHVGMHHPLASLMLQQELEQMAYKMGDKGQRAPAQRITDFLSGKPSSSLPQSSYLPGLVASPLHEWLPPYIAGPLKAGLSIINKKMKGFVTSDAIMAGVESRTSSPVRVPRNAVTRMHNRVNGLFPCGEGSGYAGGIVSSAVDGEESANGVARYLSVPSESTFEHQ